MRCFVIGPIGDQLAELGSPERAIYESAVQVFEEIIRGACKAFEIDAYRADEINDPGEIPEQVFEALRDEQLVIADLTGANPNVMYELGLRHAVGKCTLQIGERGRLPFDINTIRTVQFVRTPTGFIKARTNLTKMIGSSLANGCKPSSATRIIGASIATIVQRPMHENHPEGGEIGSEAEVDLDAPEGQVVEEPLGFIDALADLEAVSPELEPRLEAMSGLIEQMGERAAAAGEESTRATTAGQRLAIMKRFSAGFTGLVKDYDQELVEFEGRISTLGVAVDVVLDQLELTEDARSDAEEYLAVLVGLGEAASASRDEGITSFRESLSRVENLSRDLRPSVRLMRADLDRTISAFNEVERWGHRAASILVPDDASTLDDGDDH